MFFGLVGIVFFLTLVNPCIATTDYETMVIFKGDHTEILSNGDDKQKLDKQHAFSAQAFVGGMYNNKEFLAIFSSAALHDSPSQTFVEGVARTSYGDHKQWSAAEVFTRVSKRRKSNSLWGDITAVIKENKIYVLATSWDKSKSSEDMNFLKILRDPLMIVGNVMNRTASNGDVNVFIKWEAENSLQDKRSKTAHGIKESQFIGGEGNGIVTTNGTIIFPIAINRNNEMIASTLYSIDDGKTWNIGGETVPGTNSGSLVEWNDKKLIFTVASNEGFRKVFESDDMGITWKMSPIFFGVWGNNPSRSQHENQGSAIKIPVDGKDVLLFSHPLNKNSKDYFDTLQLWLSDGQRIVCIGAISDEEKEENSGNSILAYVGKHLYVTHRMNPFGRLKQITSDTKEDWSRVIGLTPLPDFLEKIKTTVTAWRQLDKTYQSKSVQTDGLVGVLGNTKDEKVWTDMYNCVNATVKGGKSVEGGFRFEGKESSGAKWPVRSQGQNQLYMFTENEFTITASIIIHNTSKHTDVFLFGASADAEGHSVLIGVGYTREKKWFAVKNSHDKTNTDVTVVLEEEYQVTITFANGKSSVLVNGVDISKRRIPIPGSISINHFFIGGTRLSSQLANDNSCTVNNVMLFSRAMQQSEIAQFTKQKGDTEMNRQAETENKRNAPENRGGHLKAKSTKQPDSYTPVSQNKLTSSLENRQSVQGTTFTRTPENKKTELLTKSTKPPETRNTVLQNRLPNAPESQHPVASNKAKDSSLIVGNNVYTAKSDNTKIINSLQKNDKAALQNKAEGDNGAAIALSSVVCMFLVFALFALSDF